MASPIQSVGEVLESALELWRAHFELLKHELIQDAKRVGSALGVIVVLLPLLLVGWGFLCVALALFLRRWLAPDVAFLSVGLLNLAIAGVGIGVSVKRLMAKPQTGDSVDELRLTARTVLPETLPSGENRGR